MLPEFGKLLLIFGIIFIIVGLIFIFGGKIPSIFYIGRLPGDIYIKRDNFTFYFPIVTCIIISILLTIILSLIFRFRH